MACWRSSKRTLRPADHRPDDARQPAGRRLAPGAEGPAALSDLPIIVVTMLGNPALVSSLLAGHSRPGEQTRPARRSAQGDPPRRPSTIHLALHRTPAGSGRSRARQAAGQPRTTHPARSGSAAPVRQRPGGRGNRHPTVPQQADHQRAKSSAMRKLAWTAMPDSLSTSGKTAWPEQRGRDMSAPPARFARSAQPLECPAAPGVFRARLHQRTLSHGP